MLEIAAKCEYEYGFNGTIGYMYKSAKDNLKWSGLSTKHYIHTIMQIGRFMSMGKKEFKDVCLEKNKMSNKDIATLLKNAYGDGK